MNRKLCLLNGDLIPSKYIKYLDLTRIVKHVGYAYLILDHNEESML